MIQKNVGIFFRAVGTMRNQFLVCSMKLRKRDVFFFFVNIKACKLSHVATFCRRPQRKGSYKYASRCVIVYKGFPP